MVLGKVGRGDGFDVGDKEGEAVGIDVGADVRCLQILVRVAPSARVTV